MNTLRHLRRLALFGLLTAGVALVPAAASSNVATTTDRAAESTATVRKADPPGT